MLLEEVALIDPVGEEWLKELSSIGEQLSDWLTVHQH
jgi:hypothetical protein